MLNDFVRDARGRGRLRRSDWPAVLEDLRGRLEGRGHAPATVRYYGLVGGHFASWSARRGIHPAAVSAHTVTEFLDNHLAACRCPLPGPRMRKNAGAAIRHLVSVLESRYGEPGGAQTARSAVDRVVAEFDSYLSETCGLSESTRVYRRRYVKEFLVAVYGEGPLDPGILDPTHVIQFVSEKAKRMRPRSCGVVASSVRSYLKFEQLAGRCRSGLIAAVPQIAHWRLAALPHVLTEEQLERLFATFDQTKAIGLRNYAISRCLADLGLRAGEVARLALDDINWRKGIVQIAGTKARRTDVLPLVDPVGRAISSYLRRGRPSTLERAIFVHHVVPIGRAIGPSVVRSAIRRAATSIGLEGRLTGTHALRHTAATRMLQSGATLKEVADVLRHRCLDTTTIYAKVDLPSLRAVALPWPEEDR